MSQQGDPKATAPESYKERKADQIEKPLLCKQALLNRPPLCSLVCVVGSAPYCRLICTTSCLLSNYNFHTSRASPCNTLTVKASIHFSACAGTGGDKVSESAATPDHVDGLWLICPGAPPSCHQSFILIFHIPAIFELSHPHWPASVRNCKASAGPGQSLKHAAVIRVSPFTRNLFPPRCLVLSATQWQVNAW